MYNNKKYNYPIYTKDHEKNEYIYDENNNKFPTIITPPFTLEVLNHYLYNGKKDFNNFRFLSINCSFGYELITLALFLNQFAKNVELIGIDTNDYNIHIIKQRLKIYNFNNINIKILKVNINEYKDEKKFDLITYKNINENILNKLNNILKDDGCIHIMTYSSVARTGINQMKELLNLYSTNINNINDKINLYRELEDKLPNTNYYIHNLQNIKDIKKDENNGVFKLLYDDVNEKSYMNFLI